MTSCRKSWRRNTRSRTRGRSKGCTHGDPFDQNASAPFFDPLWMFQLHDGFDIVIGNPPMCGRKRSRELKPALQKVYGEKDRKGPATRQLCRYGGPVRLFHRARDAAAKAWGRPSSYITSNKWYRAKWRSLRHWMNVNARPAHADRFRRCERVRRHRLSHHRSSPNGRPTRPKPEDRFRALNWQDLANSADPSISLRWWRRPEFDMPNRRLRRAAGRSSRTVKLRLCSPAFAPLAWRMAKNMSMVGFIVAILTEIQRLPS